VARHELPRLALRRPALRRFPRRTDPGLPQTEPPADLDAEIERPPVGAAPQVRRGRVGVDDQADPVGPLHRRAFGKDVAQEVRRGRHPERRRHLAPTGLLEEGRNGLPIGLCADVAGRREFRAADLPVADRSAIVRDQRRARPRHLGGVDQSRRRLDHEVPQVEKTRRPEPQRQLGDGLFVGPRGHKMIDAEPPTGLDHVRRRRLRRLDDAERTLRPLAALGRIDHNEAARPLDPPLLRRRRHAHVVIARSRKVGENDVRHGRALGVRRHGIERPFGHRPSVEVHDLVDQPHGRGAAGLVNGRAEPQRQVALGPAAVDRAGHGRRHLDGQVGLRRSGRREIALGENLGEDALLEGRQVERLEARRHHGDRRRGAFRRRRDNRCALGRTGVAAAQGDRRRNDDEPPDSQNPDWPPDGHAVASSHTWTRGGL